MDVRPPLNPYLFSILGSKGLFSCDPRAFLGTTTIIPWSMEGGGAIMGGGYALLHRHVPFWPFSLTLEVKGNVFSKGPVPSGPPLATTLAGVSSLAKHKPHSPVAGEENMGWGWGAITKFLRRFTGNICHRDPLSACEMHFLPRRGSRMAIGGGSAFKEAVSFAFWWSLFLLVFLAHEVPQVLTSRLILPFLGQFSPFWRGTRP